MTGESPSHRARAAATAALAAGTGGLACWVLAAIVAGSWAALQRPAPLPDDVIALLAGAVGVLLCGWWTVGAALTALAALAHDGVDGAGRLARAARAVTPGVVRRAVVLSVGVSLVAGGTAARASAPAGTGPVIAPARPVQVAATLDHPIDPVHLPDLPDLPDLGWGTGPAGSAPARAPSVLVRPGDSLWALAEQHLQSSVPSAGRTAAHGRHHRVTEAQIAKAWPGWFAANRTVIGADPDHLEPGQRLVPPA